MSDVEFIETYIKAIKFFVSKYHFNKSNEDDLAQDCIIALLNAKDKILDSKSKRQILSFVGKVCINTIRDKTKHKNSRYSDIVWSSDDDERVNQLYVVDDLFIGEDVKVLFNKIKSILNDDQMKIVNFLIQNKSQGYIAENLEINQSSVSSRIKTIRKKLKENGVSL